jgi:hypothetical protein
MAVEVFEELGAGRRARLPARDAIPDTLRALFGEVGRGTRRSCSRS